MYCVKSTYTNITIQGRKEKKNRCLYHPTTKEVNIFNQNNTIIILIKLIDYLLVLSHGSVRVEDFNIFLTIGI